MAKYVCDFGEVTSVGDKVIDVEATPAENLTIQQLFAKVKELETLISKAPYISNSILSELSGITDINVISLLIRNDHILSVYMNYRSFHLIALRPYIFS